MLGLKLFLAQSGCAIHGLLRANNILEHVSLEIFISQILSRTRKHGTGL